MNIKAMIPVFVAVLAALVVYELVVKGLISKYDDTFDGLSHFEKKKSNAKLRNLIDSVNQSNLKIAA